MLKIHAKEKSLELLTDYDQNIPTLVMADSLRLNQILMNLIGNAIKFTQHGQVALKVEVIDKKGNNVQVKFSVSDTGIGIAKENIEKIFETFEQADEQTTIKFGGTGLGLSIVKNLAKLKGGILEVFSEENKGSTFCFTNWYEVLSNDAQEKPAGQTKLLPFENVSILVAEDNPINAFLIKKILKDWNISFDLVENGREALEQLKEKDYDLVLMDTFMPVMNGLDAIKLIRDGYVSGKEQIPVITFSAAVLEDDKRTAINAGANDVISKPFELDVLHRKITLYAAKN